MGTIEQCIEEYEQEEAEKEEPLACPVERGVIKRVCSEASGDCKPCICREPHVRHHLPDEKGPCSTWNYCYYKGRKVRCTKVL